MSFLEMVEPFILSDDKYLRQFALEEIDKSFIATPKTFFHAFKALDHLEPSKMKNRILPYTHSYPFSDEVIHEFSERLKVHDDNYIWYCLALEHCDPVLLMKHKHLKKYLGDDIYNLYTSLLTKDVEELFMTFGELANELWNEKFDQRKYEFVKLIFKELIRRGEYDDPREVEIGLKYQQDQDYFDFDGIYNVFIAGECRMTTFVPLLVSLLDRVDEDILMEELTETLIKIGNVAVVNEVAKKAKEMKNSFEAIEILGHIKCPEAEKHLLELFDMTEDLTMKTLIADALCCQLSVQAIPKVASMIETGYDEATVQLEESLYVCCMITGTDHPMIPEWKKAMMEYDEKVKEAEDYLVERLIKPIKVEKIGRNEPCPCGSGKKYKKCCGA